LRRLDERPADTSGNRDHLQAKRDQQQVESAERDDRARHL
jgi:hypothetical protein